MALIVADSDVLIDVLRGRRQAAERVAFELRGGSLATTTISLFELRSGARGAADRELIEGLLRPFVLLSVDEPAAIRAADVRRTLDAAGIGIATADCLIAGVCLARSAVLLTRNRRHFERVPGLSTSFIET